MGSGHSNASGAMAPKYLCAVRDNEWRCICFAPIPTFRRIATCRVTARPLRAGALVRECTVRSRGVLKSLQGICSPKLTPSSQVFVVEKDWPEVQVFRGG